MPRKILRLIILALVVVSIVAVSIMGPDSASLSAVMTIAGDTISVPKP